MVFYERKDAIGVWVGCDEYTPFPHAIEALYDHLSGAQLELFNTVCANLVCPKAFITKHAAEYGWDDHLINRAKFYTPSVLPRPIPYFQPYWKCYENSFAFAKKRGLRYVEGVAVNPTGVMIHAWCSTDGIDVIDYTWPYQHTCKYFGIEWDLDWLTEKGYPRGGILGYLELKARKKQAVA